jgi:hypothetical protein
MEAIHDHITRPDRPTGPTVMRTVPALWTRLPVGGWQVGFWADPRGRTLIDVVGPEGTLAYRIAGARRAAPSIDAGWAGYGQGRDGGGQCWALAIGHAPAGRSHVVSFDRRAREGDHDRMTLPPEALCGLWVTHNGLWAAAATGRYTHARLTVQSAIWLSPLRLVTGE